MSTTTRFSAFDPKIITIVTFRMLNRLVHTSNRAYLRYMQMSAEKVFVFVEGKTDRSFYDRVCSASLAGTGIDHQICLAKELDETETGGKTRLVNFFRFLRSSGALLGDFKGKRTVCVFYLDKDIDDVRKRLIESDHVIYTKSYHFENYLFQYGDLNNAVAVAASLARLDVDAHINVENDRWCRRAALSWRDWMILCFYCGKRMLGAACTYASFSQVNAPYGNVNSVQLEAIREALRNRLGMTPRGFKTSLSWAEKQVESYFASRQFDAIFKGIWYVKFLEHDAKAIAGGSDFNQDKLVDRLITALDMSLDFSKPWADHLKTPVYELANRP